MSKILIIEDEAAIRRVLVKILSEENILVSSYLKKNKDKNFIEAYNELGIVICDEKGNVLEKIELPVI